MSHMSLVPDPPPADPTVTDEVEATRIGHHVDCGGVVLLVGHADDAGRYCSTCGESGATCVLETDSRETASTSGQGAARWWRSP